jgi:hypothetical protein
MSNELPKEIVLHWNGCRLVLPSTSATKAKPITDQLPEKIYQDRLRRALRWHGHNLWKPKRRTDYRYWVVDASNTCIDGGNSAEELLERWLPRQ